MRNRRRYSRYDVTNVKAVHAKTLSGAKAEKWMTLSAGGCGFEALPENCPYEVGQTVTSEFIIPDEKFSVSILGEIKYKSPSGANIFYGIEFEDLESLKIDPVLDFALENGAIDPDDDEADD